MNDKQMYDPAKKGADEEIESAPTTMFDSFDESYAWFFVRSVKEMG